MIKKSVLVLALLCAAVFLRAEGIVCLGKASLADYPDRDRALTEAQVNAELQVLEILCGYLDIPLADYSTLSDRGRAWEKDGVLTARITVKPDLWAMWQRAADPPAMKIFVVMDSYFEGKPDLKETGLSVFLERFVNVLDIARPELYKDAVKNVALNAERDRKIMEIARKNGIWFALFVNMAITTESVVTDGERRSKSIISAHLKNCVTGKTLWSTKPALRADYLLREGSMYERSAGNICDVFYETCYEEINRTMAESFLIEKYYEMR